MSWANVNWSTNKDTWASFKNNCALGIMDEELDKSSISLYRNTISIKANGTVTIFNLTGQRVHQSRLTGQTSISLDKGIYLVRVTDGGRSVTKKVYLN
ncbi:MAG: T9SS type A sorting domain-containing protein [Bacteroidetes bacterium]|nr:T9SS type A sorting domain-containing protein [Bacteroidota bacterium]